MEPHEVEIDGRWWRVTQIAPDQRFKVEQHTKGVGWDTIMEPAILREGDETLFHDNSMDEEVIECIECAIGSYLENERRLESMIPGCSNGTHLERRIIEALELIERYGGIDGGHHKQWLLDQIVRKITGERYEMFRAGFIDTDEGESYDCWEEGIAP